MVSSVTVPTAIIPAPLSRSGETDEATFRSFLSYMQSLSDLYFSSKALPPHTRQHTLEGIRMTIKNLEECIDNEEDKLWGRFPVVQQITCHQNATAREISCDYSHDNMQATPVTDKDPRKRIFHDEINKTEPIACSTSEEDFVEKPRKVASVVASVAKPPAKKQKRKSENFPSVTASKALASAPNRTNSMRKNQSTNSLSSGEKPTHANPSLGNDEGSNLTNDGKHANNTHSSRSASLPSPSKASNNRNKFHLLKPNSTGEGCVRSKSSTFVITSGKESAAAKPMAHDEGKGRKPTNDGKSAKNTHPSYGAAPSVSEERNDLGQNRQLKHFPVTQQKENRVRNKVDATKRDSLSKRNPVQSQPSRKIKQCAKIATIHHFSDGLDSSKSEGAIFD